MENINNTVGKQKDRGEKNEMNGVIKMQFSDLCEKKYAKALKAKK